MTLPNFLLIGAAKAGTTSLGRYLDQHPQVLMSPVKEPRYFNHDDYGPLHAQQPVRNLASYEELFAGATADMAIGEATVRYLYNPEVPPRIAAELPRAKLVAIVRHPAERAWSHFLHSRRLGWEPISDFEAALDREGDELRPGWGISRNYLSAGLYATQLEAFSEWRDDGRLLVLFFDDFVVDPAATCRTVFGFLGVDTSFVPDVSVRHNSAVFPSFQRLDAIVGRLVRTDALRRLAQVVPQSTRTAVLGGTRRYQTGKELPLNLRQRLIAGTRDDTLALQEMLGRDLAAWLR